MKLRILIDMNLSPEWSEVLNSFGWEAAHWMDVGDPRAPDSQIMAWAKREGYIVFTHDLDFGSLLASTNAAAPSVIQVRIQDVLPNLLGDTVNAALQQFTDELLQGAIITIDEQKVRARVLPLRRRKD
jgi:predicted nuclease of predicted toxin-antitoxin system